MQVSETIEKVGWLDVDDDFEPDADDVDLELEGYVGDMDDSEWEEYSVTDRDIQVLKVRKED